MKKRYYWMLCMIALLICLLSCQVPSSSVYNVPPIVDILEVDVEEYHNIHNFKHQYEVKRTPEITRKEDVNEKKTINVDGEIWQLKYVDTYYYPVGDITVDCYEVVGAQEENACVMLLDDSIYAILYEPVCILDISPTDNITTVKAKVEDELSWLIEFKNFEEFKYTSTFPEDYTRFGGYHCVWYNKAGTATCGDYVTLRVSDDGRVTGLYIHPEVETDIIIPTITAPDVNGNIQSIPNDISGLLYTKLSDIYTTETTSLETYEVTESQLIRYEGEIVLFVTVDVCFNMNEGEGFGSELCSLIVKFEKDSNVIK